VQAYEKAIQLEQVEERRHQRGGMGTRRKTMRRDERWGKTPWRVEFRPKRRPLPERADFVVVGGGFAGLSAAAYLKKLAPGKNVVVLEAGSLGNGASGRTGGMALEDTAAGKLPRLGKVLAGYRKILRELGVKAELSLPGVWELSHGGRPLDEADKKVRAMRNSPIAWNDSSELRAVRKVRGGTVNPGKVVAELARAAEEAGAQIVEHAEVREMGFDDPLRVHVRLRAGRGSQRKTILAERVLLATNAGALALSGLDRIGEPKLTFALATGPLKRGQIAALGLSSGRPFYTLDLPYLWGRLFERNRIIFGSGLVPAFGESLPKSAGRGKLWSGLEQYDSREGEAGERLRWLENRVRELHPVLKNVRIAHRWGGPILITKDFFPIFRRHRKSNSVLVLGGFSGHGVALAVYLGKWAAEAMLGRRPLPTWTNTRQA
jgi:glycine/D-amino acid oxidase-like deaminating enzyme